MIMFYLMHKIKKSQKGFTLVELVVAMGIVAILSAVAVPMFLSALPTFKLRAAARDLYGTMQQARASAIKEGKDWGVVFNGPSDSFRLCSEDSPGAGNWTSLADITCADGTISLSTYGHGIGFSSVSVDGSTSIGASFGADGVSYSQLVATFNARGYGTAGYCYLKNNKDESFAVGTQTSGVIKMVKWSGTAWVQ